MKNKKLARPKCGKDGRCYVISFMAKVWTTGKPVFFGVYRKHPPLMARPVKETKKVSDIRPARPRRRGRGRK